MAYGKGVQEIFENQRYYVGLAWKAPGLLERPSWSDAEGRAVTLAKAPTEEEPGAWELLITQGTDLEGWQYGSTFSHLDYPREGGRSSRQTFDVVRRRVWRHRDGSGSASAARLAPLEQPRSSEECRLVAAKEGTPRAVSSLVSPATQVQGHRSRRQTERDKRLTVLRLFVNMFLASIRRLQIWNLLPLDPAGWFVLYSEQQAALAAAVQQQMPRRLPLGAAAAEPHDQAPVLEGADHATLAQELHQAAMYTRASYGYAMAAGHLASIRSFAFMVTFTAAAGASGEANNRAIETLAGIQAGDILMSEWNNSVLRPCHYVAVDRSNHCLVLCIRGSLEVGDVFSDISANSLEVDLLGRSGKVHEGIMAAATYVHCNTAPALHLAAQRFPDWPLLVTGHSLGGGVAALVTVLLREHGSPEGLGPVRCITLGGASVMSHNLADACHPFITSVILRSDPVPRLSYASMEGMFLELVDASPVRRAAKGLSRKVTKTFEGLKVDWNMLQKPPRLMSSPAEKSQGLASVIERADSKVLQNAHSARSLVQLSLPPDAAAKGAVAAASAEDAALCSVCDRSSMDVGCSSVFSAAAQAVKDAVAPLVPSSTDSAAAANGAASQQAGDEAQPLMDTSIQVAADYVDGADPAALHNATDDAVAMQSRLSKLLSTSWLRSSSAPHKAEPASPSSHTFPSQPPAWQEHRADLDSSSAMTSMDLDVTPSTVPQTQSMQDQQPAQASAHQQQEQQPNGGAHKQTGPSNSKLAGVSEGGAEKLQRASSEKQETVAEVFGSKNGNPEPLYPAGRVLWIIPTSNPSSEEDSDEEAGLFQTGDLGISAWEDAPFLPSTQYVEPSASQVAAAAGANTDSAQPTAASAPAKSTSPLEPVATSAQGGGVSAGASAESPHMSRTPRSAGRRKSPPYILDVDRRIFARLLISPDMAADHLPDNYLFEIQEL